MDRLAFGDVIHRRKRLGLANLSLLIAMKSNW
jgi:hypothetical protein